ncbi:c-type cytochrome domain-containing protein [Botrimarina sp.]|uniref:c-type cytochrome domain-containing protein n=1 Tax=Botrimarina sp. TaxID=2795802 RepID=UPI0032EAE3D0
MATPIHALAAALLIFSTSAAIAAEGASYRSAVRGVLERHCVVCHGAGRGSAGLDLSSYEGVIAGGASGEVVVGGAPDDSFLYLVTAHDEEPVMPPGGERVPDADLALLRRWIELGLPETDDDIDPAAPAMSAAPSAAETPTPPADPGGASPERHGPVVALAASESADRLAVGRQLAVWLYEASTQRPIGALPFPEGEPQSLAFSADGEWLTAAGGTHGRSGAVVVWSLQGEPARAWQWADATDAVLTADLSPDRRRVVVGGPSRKVRVLSTLSGEEAQTHDKPTDWVLQARFSPDGLLVAATDRDGGVYVWETETGALLHSLRGHKDAAVALEWLEGGDRLATASLDGDLRLWDMHTGETAGRWTAHEAGVAALAVAGDGALVTVGKSDNTALRWSLDGVRQEVFAMDNPARLLNAAIAEGSRGFFGTLDGGVLTHPGDRPGASPTPVPIAAPPNLLAQAPAPADARAALGVAPRPPVEAVASLSVETPPARSLALSAAPAAAASGLSEFDRGVRAARLADALAALRRLEDRVEELGVDGSTELEETRLLLGIARERLERAARDGAGGAIR